MYNHNLIRLFLLNRIWISKTEIIINKKKKKKNMHHSLISFNIMGEKWVSTLTIP